MKKLSLLQVNTFYPQFMKEVYKTEPGLHKCSFDDQTSKLLARGFSAIHNYVPYIDPFGYWSRFIIANNPYGQLRWAEDNGIEPVQHKGRLDEILRYQIEAMRPDVLLMMDAFNYDSRFMKRLSFKPPVVAGWTGEYIPPNVDWADFDIILSNYGNALNTAIEKGARSTCFFHPGFLKWLFDEVSEITPQFDVVFVGQWSPIHKTRNQMLIEVARESSRSCSFSLGLYLSGDGSDMPAEVSCLQQGERFGLDMHRALRTGRIALNADTTGEAGNMRMFEATGTGVFLLTQHHDNISDYFIPGEEIETFRNRGELLEKIQYYVAHDDEREDIARRGQERCLRDYSMEGQLKKLDGIFRSYLCGKDGPEGRVSLQQSGENVPGQEGGINVETEAVHINIASGNLDVLRNIAEKQRFGNWCVHCFGLRIYCHDLLSLYHSANNIFVRGIYDFDAENGQPLIVDGGAHIGLFALRAKQRYPKSQVISFEPDSKSLERFERNVEENHLNGIRIVRAGLHKYDGQISFSSDHSDASSIFAGEDGNSINVVRLSKYINREVDFLKLNIEGSELDVILEMAEKLPLIKEMVIEYHGFPETGQKLHDILLILDRAGFRYLIHDFDSAEQPCTKPPFRIKKDTRFYLLVYAKRLFNKASGDARIVANRNSGECGVYSESLECSSPGEGSGIVRSDRKAYCESGVRDMNRVVPVSSLFGCDRGRPIDRYYIDAFLKANKMAITGRVLEIGNDHYTKRYGRDVVQSDVLSYVSGQEATIVGDLTTGENIPKEAFDCIIMTQTLQFIFDVDAAIKGAFKALKHSGVMLVTTSGLSQISRYDMERWGDYWRITDKCLGRLLRGCFDAEKIHIESYGNVAVAKAFLDGLSLHEIDHRILEYSDNDYQVIVSGVAVK